MEEQLESLKQKEKTMEQNVKQIEEEKIILKEKVQTFENLLTERNDDDEEEELYEGNRMVDCNDDFIEEIEVINQVLTNEKEFQSSIENNLADLSNKVNEEIEVINKVLTNKKEFQSSIENNLPDLSNKDGYITRDNLIDGEDPVVTEGEKTSNDGETYATSNADGGGEKSIKEVVDEITDDINLNDGRAVNNKRKEDLSPLSNMSKISKPAKLPPEANVLNDGVVSDVDGNKVEHNFNDGEITSDCEGGGLESKEGGVLESKNGKDKRKDDISPLANTSKRSKPAKIPSEGMKVWVWQNNEKFLWKVQSKKDRLPNGGCFNCKNVVGVRKNINFNEVKWDVCSTSDSSTEGMGLDDPDGATPDFQNGEEGDKGVPGPFGLPPPPVTSTPLDKNTPRWWMEGFGKEIGKK